MEHVFENHLLWETPKLPVAKQPDVAKQPVVVNQPDVVKQPDVVRSKTV